MNTNTKTNCQAIWYPDKNSIWFLENGKPICGFVGNTATKKFCEALADPNIELIIKDSTPMDKTQLIKRLHAIMAKKGLMDLKAEIIAQYDVKSSKDLTVEQLQELIEKLQNQEVRADVRVQRSTVLNLLDKLGIKGSKETGWERVNTYLSNPRIAGKTLYQMTLKELKDTEAKLRSIIYKQNNPKIK